MVYATTFSVSQPEALRHLMNFAPREIRQVTANEPRIVELVRELPDLWRQVITLRFVYRLSHSQIAARLGLPLACVTETLALGLRRVTETRDKRNASSGH